MALAAYNTYFRASIVYNIMLLKLILTPNFSINILEENAVDVRMILLHVQQPLLYCLIKIFKSINLNPSPCKFAFKTVLSFFKTLTLFFYSMFSFKLRNKIGRFGKLTLFTELTRPS